MLWDAHPVFMIANLIPFDGPNRLYEGVIIGQISALIGQFARPFRRVSRDLRIKTGHIILAQSIKPNGRTGTRIVEQKRFRRKSNLSCCHDNCARNNHGNKRISKHCSVPNIDLSGAGHPCKFPYDDTAANSWPGRRRGHYPLAFPASSNAPASGAWPSCRVIAAAVQRRDRRQAFQSVAPFFGFHKYIDSRELYRDRCASTAPFQMSQKAESCVF